MIPFGQFRSHSFAMDRRCRSWRKCAIALAINSVLELPFVLRAIGLSILR